MGVGGPRDAFSFRGAEIAAKATTVDVKTDLLSIDAQ